MATSFAIFDLDDTLIKGDSSILWTQYLWDNKIITDPQFVEADRNMMAQYSAGNLDMASYLAFSMQGIAGISIEQIDIWLDDFVETIILPNVFPEGIARLADYKQRKIPIIIISASVSFIVKKIALRLGVDIAMGIDMKIENNAYSNKIAGIPSFKEGKVKRLTQWLSQQHIEDAEIIFYTDSANDLPLCYFADYVFTINADSRLSQAAIENKWTQLSWHI